MYHFRDDLSRADDILYVRCNVRKEDEEKIKNYEFRRLVFDPPRIPLPFRPEYRNMAYLTAWSPDSEDMRASRKIIDEYNEYVNYLEQLDGFRDFFIEHHLSVSKKEVAEKWSQEIADRIFSLEDSVFKTDLFVLNDYMFDVNYPKHYEVLLNGTNVILPLGDYCEYYPEKAGDKSLIWNWVEIGNDFCYTLWRYLGAPDCKDENTDIEEDNKQVSYYYDYYEEWRNDYIRYPQLVRVFKKLESMGYLHAYTLKPEHEDAWWFEYGKIDGSIDVAIIDDSFRNNKPLMEQIELLMWSTE